MENPALVLASVILAVHVLIIGFNIFGLVAIPLGAWRGWRFVHAPLWRLLHLGSIGITALQAAMGQACFLTIWQVGLEGEPGNEVPLIMGWVNSIIFWPLPLWVFTTIYLLILAYVLALLVLVPVRRR